MVDTFFAKDRWLYALQMNLEASCGVREKLYKLSRVPQFWKVPQVSVSQLSAIANTGDVLLFKGENFNSTFQRFLTNSEWGSPG